MTLARHAFLFTVFFLQSYLLRFSVGPYPSNLLEVFIAVTALAWLVHKCKNWKWNLRQHAFIAGFLLLTLWSVLTLSFLPILDASTLLTHLKVSTYAMALLFLYKELFEPKEYKLVLKWMSLGALTFGIFAVFWNLLGMDVTYDYRLTGPLDSAVYLAFTLSPFLIFEFLAGAKWRALAFVVLLLLTRSFGAVLAVSVVLGMVMLYQQRALFKKNKPLLAASAIFALGLLGLTFYVKVLPVLQEGTSSLGERFEIWQTSWHLLQNWQTWIFGLGLGQFQAHYEGTVFAVLGREPMDYWILQPHNIFLLSIFQYGLPGLLVLAWVTFKRRPLVVQAMLAYLLLHGLIDTPFFKSDLLFLLIFILGVLEPRAGAR